MGREVRRVPKDWEHPKDNKGNHEPLDGKFTKRSMEWREGQNQWIKGLRESFVDYPKIEWVPIEGEDKELTYAEYAGDRPRKEHYMPEWTEEEKTHYQMYETCSEGTPISPVMAAPEELAAWLVDNDASSFGSQTASYESWLSIAKGNDVCSAALIPGRGLVNGVDAFNDGGI
jgi:hypothetical protein